MHLAFLWRIAPSAERSAGGWALARPLVDSLQNGAVPAVTGQTLARVRRCATKFASGRGLKCQWPPTGAPPQAGYHQPAHRISTNLKVAYKDLIDTQKLHRRLDDGAMLADVYTLICDI